MSKFYDPVFTDAVKDVIGNEPVLDQFDIDYPASFYGSTADDYITGTMLVETKAARGKRYRTFVTGSRPRGRAVSKYFSGDALPAEDDPSSSEVVYNPLQSFREVPWSARVSRTAYRISQAFDSKERLYDSCLPNLRKCFEVDGNSKLWTINKVMGPGYQTTDDSRIWPLLSPVGNVVTESVGFMYFNGGGINLDRPQDEFVSGFDENIFSNDDWTWSYPYESKYSPTERIIKNQRLLGIENVDYIADWDGYNFKSITSSITLGSQKKIKHFMPILPGKVRPDILAGFGARNTFRSQYSVTAAYGYKTQLPADPLNSSLDNEFGLSYLFPSDMNLSDVDDRTNWMEPWRKAFGPGFFERPGPEPLTGSMTFDDTVRFLFGFGDLNNMTYAERLLTPASDVLYATASLSLNSTTANFSNGETVTISSITYTFRTVLTPAAGEVLIGSTGKDSLQNLVYAINLDPATAGVKYDATAGTLSFTALRELSGLLPTMTIRAFSPGHDVNGTVTSETCANASWQSSDIRNGRGIFAVEPYGMSETNTSWLESDGNSTTLSEPWRIYAPGLKVRWQGSTNPRAWKWASGGSPLSDTSAVLMTGSTSGVTRRFHHLSGNLGVSPPRGLFWHSKVYSTSDESLDGDLPAGPWGTPVLISDTDTTSGGDMSSGQSSLITLEVVSDYPWTLTYDRAIASNTTSKLEVLLGGGRDNEYALFDVLSGSGTGAAPAYNYSVMKQNDLRVNGMSASYPTNFPGVNSINPEWLPRSPYPYPIDAGTYTIGFNFRYVAGAGRPEPNRAAVKNIRIIQYTPKSFPPVTGTLIGANNYPYFRKINRDHRIDYDLGYGERYTFPAWQKPSKEVIDRYTKFYTSLVFTPNRYDDAGVGNFPYNALIHSGTLFGVSPEIRGWKYGLYSGFPTNTKAVFRRNSYGQLRDMLEQRQYTKFVMTDSAVFDDDPIESNEDQQDSAAVGTTGRRKAKSTDEILPGVVQVDFVRQRYRRDARGIGEIYNVKVDPAQTVSQNLSSEVTSSLPYFDGTARHRSEDDLSKVADTKITSFTYVDGNLTVT